MKFKINKQQAEFILDMFSKKDDWQEIELEPVWETFREAEKFETQIKNKAYETGYDIGFKNGYAEGRYKEFKDFGLKICC